METILLVEPNYQNKYPPIGLMKLATYHKQKGDHVIFYKGKAPFVLITKVDRVYITSLFTFYFDITVDTINHYTQYINKENIFLGGIAATIMPERFRKATGLNNILLNQLTDSQAIGYSDHINIDILPLDYDILDDVEYEYGTDNFFAYATRGCPRKCKFCAVKILEPVFLDTNNLYEQIIYVRENFGDKRNIMMMDNNIIFSEHLEDICSSLLTLGFVNNSPTYMPPNPAALFYKKLYRRLERQESIWLLEERFISFLEKFIKRIKNTSVLSDISEILVQLRNTSDKSATLLEHKDLIINTVEKYRTKKRLQRYVDFNQGLDARLLTDEKMAILARLPLRPFRLAYDNIASTEAYVAAFECAYKYGVRHFSNYLLYNFDDTPEDLWQRIRKNIDLYNKYQDISAFSFPMKYAPVDMTDRSYIGIYWNKKYLSAMNLILNVTKGVVAKELDFFERAYGRSPEEFKEILAMPNNFIKYRNHFEKNGLIERWRLAYRNLSIKKRNALLEDLSEDKKCFNNPIMEFYAIKK